jgi:hypothetical protein
MKYKLLSCEVFMRMSSHAIAKTPHIIDVDYTKLGAHEAPDTLNGELQQKIDIADATNEYDAILLGYGLCGNTTVGITARTIPLVIPRAHDCCTVFLGSKAKFVENFGDKLSSLWSSAEYMERCNDYLRDTDTGKLLGLDNDFAELVQQYGEETAKYVWDTLHPENHDDELIFIEVAEFSHLGYLEKMKAHAKEENKSLKVLDGDMRIINALIQGDWNNEDFLIVPPGKQIKAVYDYDKVIDII